MPKTTVSPKKKIDPYTTTRIWTGTLQKLRLASEGSGETMVKVMDRLIDGELNRQAKKAKEVAND